MNSFVQVLAEAVHGFGEAAHAAEEQGAVTIVVRFGRLDQRQQLDCPERRRPIPSREMQAADVSKHPGQDLAAARGTQEAWMKQDAITDRLPQQGLAVVGGERPAATRWIQKRSAGRPDDEVAR